MDPSTGRLSPLLNMLNAMKWPASVTTENKIFVFSDGMVLDSPGIYSSEVYEAVSGRWSPLPLMIEKRRLCAAVSIANSSALVIGGIGRNQVGLRSTELLTQLAGEGGGGGGEKWQWRLLFSMNEEHGGDILAAYFQERVYVVGCEEYVDAMEMLDVAADGQWTSLTSNGWSLCQPLRVGSKTSVDNLLFIADYDSYSVYSIELEIDRKRRNTKLGEMKEIWKDSTYMLLTTILLK
ncbi:unnamed protein product [Hymenolepis diminuta]|uniref:Uncharacterized protein n=1 Tax=Hymenolepis diminuta TaxID=6216 RepID=A0A564ZB41_HYMDI|nr:unnamed protein product [Hymenolepis diminuta]